jgi:Methyltransferase FkbM domain
MAVSDGACGRVALFPGRSDISSEWNIVGHDVSGRATHAELEVPAIALDSYFRPGSRVDFAKMDIEGAEIQALQGMKRIIQESRPIFVIEFHNQQTWDGRRELVNRGYSLYDPAKRRWVESEGAPERVYHAVAVPSEKSDVVASLAGRPGGRG